MRPFRTVLEQKIRERRMTFEEFVAYAETFAREHREPGTSASATYSASPPAAGQTAVPWVRFDQKRPGYSNTSLD
jgi:hypothetical protein